MQFFVTIFFKNPTNRHPCERTGSSHQKYIPSHWIPFFRSYDADINLLTGKIIFCNYKQEIDLFYTRFTQIGLSVAFIDGRINKQQRNIILSKPYDVLILQIQTGCEGLNLQQYYSEIYFVSPHWNPAVEDQAIARCHRLGQHNTVYVFRFQMETFDDTHDTYNIETYTTSTQQNKRIKVSEIIS